MKTKHYLVILIAIVLIIVGYYAAISSTKHDFLITVTEKERVQNGESSKYLIWGNAEDGEQFVFENTDTLYGLKFNSSDIYGKLEIGKRYRISVIGWRIPLFSSYQNIVSVDAVQ